MTVVATVAGAALIALALRDVFDTLFHPHGRGIVSERLVRAVWGWSEGSLAGVPARSPTPGPSPS